MAEFYLKIKFNTKQFIVHDFEPETTINTLKTRIAHLIGTDENRIHVLAGYPPRSIDLSKNLMTLSTAGIINGDVLIVKYKIDLIQKDRRDIFYKKFASDISNPTTTMSTTKKFDGKLVKKSVASDDSCLFSSIRFVINGKPDTESSRHMRQIIAQKVSQDPEFYNTAFLGKTNKDYCVWIQKPDSWGGAIEVAILSHFYGLEIDVVDAQNGIINRFGEDKNYRKRVFIYFEGNHYDPLCMEKASMGEITTIFPVDAVEVYEQALHLANAAKNSLQTILQKKVTNDTFRCLDCNAILFGSKDAQQHANKSGHINFSEI